METEPKNHRHLESVKCTEPNCGDSLPEAPKGGARPLARGQQLRLFALVNDYDPDCFLSGDARWPDPREDYVYDIYPDNLRLAVGKKVVHISLKNPVEHGWDREVVDGKTGDPDTVIHLPGNVVELFPPKDAA